MSHHSRQLTLSISAETDKLVFGKSDTSHTEKGFYTNRKGQKLFTRFWHPDHLVTPRAIAFISHGFSEHLGNYHTIGEELAKENILAFGHDHIGHGQSEGIPAYIEDVDDYVDDLVEHCKSVQNRYDSNVPLFIVAHSMGGMIALRAAICYPKMFRGMVLVGPLIIPGATLGPIDFRVTSFRALPVRAILGTLSWFNPEMILGGVNMDLISRDEEVKRALASDNLRWSSGCKVRMLLAFVDCLENNYNLMAGLKVPFLSLHGTEDGLCNVEGSRLLKQCSYVDDKEVKEYEGSAHNLFMEIAEVRHCVVNKTVAWIVDRS